MNARQLPPLDVEPVAVIGNGPVGQTAALLLARWGIPVVLLDAREQRDAVGSKAICQQRDVLDIWSAVGGEQIAAEGLTWTTARTFYGARELFAWTFTDRGSSPLPPFVNVSQGVTERVLDEQIAAQPLIDVRWGHEVTGIEQSRDGVAITCRVGHASTHVPASYAVACAGARGDALRTMLGVSFEGQTFDDRFLICDIRSDIPDWAAERRFYFDPEWNPGGQVLIHPCPGSTFRIDWQVAADFDLEAEAQDGRLDARIRQIVGERPYEIVWKSVYRFHARCVDKMRVGRVLIAGDCAHLVAPFGARGLNSGVADAENAAWKLAFVLRGWAPEGLLDSYNDERLAAARENLEVTSQTMRFLVPQNEDEWRARRDLLDAAIADEEAKSRVDSGRFAEPFWYVGSPLTTPHPQRAFPGRPVRGATPVVVPGVVLPDGPAVVPGRPEVTRLRHVVRDGFTALTLGADAAAVARNLADATDAPTGAFPLEEVDFTGAVTTALDARPGEVWLIRPDSHVAAVLHTASPTFKLDLTNAVRRSVGGAQEYETGRVS